MQKLVASGWRTSARSLRPRCPTSTPTPSKTQ
jgi:hypothetical protein